MSGPGIGVMLGYLGGNEETVKAYHSILGREIAAARLDEDVRGDGAVVLDFSDGWNAVIWDGGRSCCESRYITTDDDLSSLVGKRLRSIELKPASSVEAEWDVHETMFVEIGTNDGSSVTLTTHNEHNGYYGGFWMQIAAQAPDTEQVPA